MISAPTEKAVSATAARLLEGNLRALRIRQPDVAAEIESAAIPVSLTPALGRDGTPTYLVASSGDPEWLGACSMPRAAAEEMFSNVTPGGGSVTLPGMLSGMECVILADKLAPRFAVFVVDAPSPIKAVLTLRDYSHWIEAGRIVLILSDDIVARTRDFFARNRGHVLSPTLLKIPQVSAGELANLTRSLEDAGAAAMQSQNELVARDVEALRGRSHVEIPHRPRIAILGSHDSPQYLDLARRIEKGCKTLGSPVTVCLPQSPDKCHAAARVRAVLDAGADMIVYLHEIPGEERRLFPSSMPVITWPVAGAAMAAPAPGSFDIIVVQTNTGRQRAVASGWPEGQTLLLEPTCDVSAIESPSTALSAKSLIKVIMDLPDDRPEALGVNLPSQIALWQALQQEVTRQADQFTDEHAADILRRAQSSSGTQLTDEPLLKLFDAWLRELIAPAIVARSVARGLVRSGFAPHIWGRHWPQFGRGADLRRGEIPPFTGRGDFLNTPAWVVIPWLCPAGVQFAIEALGCGNAVLMRGDPQEFIQQYPGLADLAHSIFWCNGTVDAATELRSLFSRHERVREELDTIARRVRTEHNMANRLQKLFDILRSRQQNQAKG